MNPIRTIFLAAIALIATLGSRAEEAETVIDGYPVANFALTVNASADGGFCGRVLQNPGKLGDWLHDRGAVEFAIEKGGKRHSFADFKQKQITRSFPFVKGVYAKSPLIATTVSSTIFAPLAINDMATSSLPVLMVELNLANRGKAEEFAIKVRPSAIADLQPCTGSGYCGAANKTDLLTTDLPGAVWADGELTLPVALKSGEQKTVRVMLTLLDREWVTANNFRNAAEVTAHAYAVWPHLRAATEAFSAAIPTTSDPELNTYLRWYMIPGISLTKCNRAGDVLTMGYCELNQRDSYWTSWLHLVLFRDLEKRMIEESIQWMQPSGKVPTTILPLIERSDDIDINAFFLLRAARYYAMYHNTAELKEWWPALKNAMDWLLTRDTNGNGLPMQVSFWGDWKDVKGVDGRLYSPFASFTYLAALKKMQQLARVCGDSEAAARYTAAYDKGYRFANLPVEEGGLWGGRYYCQRWRDGSVNTHLLQDQTVGILFDVIPAERAASIIEALNSQALTPYGVAETFPYYPDSFGYEQGTYHNGGVWPWISFMDDWARLHMGRTSEAVNLIKTVAKADLIDSGDWSPNEHINSRTGQNLGFQLQGWNANLFGLVYFGLLHPTIVP